jgi:ABC-type uncharacterized transport system substrate-binding protein
MNRRNFVVLLGSWAAAWPLATRAQQLAKVFRVGFLGVSRDAPGVVVLYQAFSDALLESGFREGQNLILQYRRNDDPRGLSASAAELLEAHPDLIVVQGPEVALQSVLSRNAAIPIVLQAINYDPIKRGYAVSMAKPGGNVTGVFYQQAELAVKKVELLTQAFPERKNLGILWDAVVAEEVQAATRAAASLRLKVQSFKLENPPYDFSAAVRSLAQGGAKMLLVLSSPLFALHRRELAELALKYNLPAIFIFKTYVQAGGLMSYGVDQAAIYRRTAEFVSKILKGASPADLPIEQPTRFELAINLKTAKALGWTIPPTLLARADEVIEWL